MTRAFDDRGLLQVESAYDAGGNATETRRRAAEQSSETTPIAYDAPDWPAAVGSRTMGHGPLGGHVRLTADGEQVLFPTPDFEWNQTAGQASLVLTLGGATIATHTVAFTPPPSGGGGGGCAGALPGMRVGSGGTALHLFGPGLAALLLFQLGMALTRRPPGARLRPVLAVTTAGAFLVVVVVPLGLGRNGGAASAAIPAGIAYYPTNHLGSTVLANPSGDGVTSLGFQNTHYRPYGESTGSAPEFAFIGPRFLAGIGLHHFGARWYDAAMGRFLQPDPLVPEPFNPQSLNRYSYVLNDPVNRVDPTGLFSIGTSVPSDADLFSGFPGTPIPNEFLGGIFAGDTVPVSSGDFLGFPPAGQPIFGLPFQPIVPAGDLTAQAVGRAIAPQPGLRRPSRSTCSAEARRLWMALYRSPGACRSHPSALRSRSATATSALAAKARLSFNSFFSWWAGRECREQLLSSSRSVGVRVVGDCPRTLMELERRCATDEVRREYLARLRWPWIPRPMPPMVRGGRGPKNKSHHMGLGVLE